MLRALVHSLLLTVPLSAQQLITVNPQGGADFENIADAQAAAQPGDIVFLHSGFYPAASINKGIRLIGTESVQLANLEIRDIPADESVSVAKIHVRGQTTDGQIQIIDSVGTIHMDRVTGRCVLFGSGTPCGNEILIIENSERVTMRDCAILGRPALAVEDSQVLINDCTLVGADAVNGGGMLPGFLDGSPAIAARNSDVRIAHSLVTGGDGDRGLVFGPTLNPAPAIEIHGGRLELASSSIVEGEPNGASSFADKISASNTDIVLLSGDLKCSDAGIGLPPSECAEIFIPSLESSRFGPGLDLQVTAFAPEISIVALYFSRPAGQLDLPFGSIWLDPAGLRMLGVGQVAAGEDRLSVDRMIPATIPLGETFTLQSAVLNGADLTISHPMTVVAY